MAEIKDFSTSPLINDLITREGRSLDAYSPVFYWVGWIAVAYLVIYVLSVYISPALFGTGPHYPFYYGRSLRTRRDLEDHALELVAKVLPALDKRQ